MNRDELERTLLAYAIVAVFAMALIIALNWRRPGRLLTMQRLRPGLWSGSAVFFQYILQLFVAIFFAVTAIGMLNDTQFFELLLPSDASRERKANLISPLPFLLSMALSFTTLYWFNRTTIADIGLSLVRWRANVMLGAGAFFVAIPVVFGTFELTQRIFPVRSHPIEALARDSLAWYEWLFLFAQVVFFAPIAEEWLFRGILQGWLRRTNLLGHAMLLWVTIGWFALNSIAGASADKAKVDAEPRWDQYAPLVFGCLLGGVYAAGALWLYRPVLTRGLRVFTDGPAGIANAPDLWTSNLFEAEGYERRTLPWSEFGPAWPAWKDANARLAIVGSAMAFALAHPWPTPIPLFLLALVLGWLTYRTQNLVPAMVLHGLFNLLSFLVLWMTVHKVDLWGVL